jgi:hypothetical protein
MFSECDMEQIKYSGCGRVPRTICKCGAYPMSIQGTDHGYSLGWEGV